MMKTLQKNYVHSSPSFIDVGIKTKYVKGNALLFYKKKLIPLFFKDFELLL